jgi:hypothetical protein
MISASKITLSQNNLNILRPKVTKNLTNLRKKFCESPPCCFRERSKRKKRGEIEKEFLFFRLTHANNINFPLH